MIFFSRRWLVVVIVLLLTLTLACQRRGYVYYDNFAGIPAEKNTTYICVTAEKDCSALSGGGSVTAVPTNDSSYRPGTMRCHSGGQGRPTTEENRAKIHHRRDGV
jgi:hypothetical protein